MEPIALTKHYMEAIRRQVDINEGRAAVPAVPAASAAASGPAPPAAPSTSAAAVAEDPMAKWYVQTVSLLKKLTRVSEEEWKVHDHFFHLYFFIPFPLSYISSYYHLYLFIHSSGPWTLRGSRSSACCAIQTRSREGRNELCRQLTMSNRTWISSDWQRDR